MNRWYVQTKNVISNQGLYKLIRERARARARARFFWASRKKDGLGRGLGLVHE